MRSLISFPLLLVSVPVAGQTPPPPETNESEEALGARDSEILVVANRLRGSVETDQPPVMTLDESAIEAYGASSVADLLAALSPQTGSGRGRGSGAPFHLLNGQRISSFRELRDLPPEAIRRVEILAEEVALRFGFPPNARVVNIILKDKFASKSLDAEYKVPTRGGFAENEFEASLLRLDGPSRLNITARALDSSMLTEAEAKVRQDAASLPTVASDPDPAVNRSLIADSRELSLNATMSTALGARDSGSVLFLNGAVTRSNSRSLFGLDNVLLVAPGGIQARRSFDDALTAQSRSTRFDSGITINKPFNGWFATATVDGSHTDTRSDTDRRRDTAALRAAAAAGTQPVTGALPALAPGGIDRARTRDVLIRSAATLSGQPFALPAGDASLTLRAGFDYSRSNNRDAAAKRTLLDRKELSGGFNLALPITSRRDNVLAGIGDITLNFSAGLNDLSDFGTLKDWSAGVSWSPTEKLGLQASYIVNEAAPSLNQLGSPRQIASNVRVFDYSILPNGADALVDIVNGGNPDLKKERQRDLKLSANWQVPFVKDSNLIVEYFRNRSTDVTQAFPLLTPEIERAFPDRVTRVNGVLTEIRRFPVTFSEIESSRIRWGFNVSGTIGKPQPGGAGRPGHGGSGRPGAGGPPPGGPPRMGGGGMGRGGPGFMGGGGGQGRWSLSLYHTVRFTETATIAPGVPQLDLLDGDALRVGGVARNAIELEGGIFHRGFGTRFNGSWQAPVNVDSVGAGDLRFGSTFVLNARAFINLDQQKSLIAKNAWLKGVRIAFEFDNLFDSRQKVTDGGGVVPLAYQPAYRDPRGRVIGIDLRKIF